MMKFITLDANDPRSRAIEKLFGDLAKSRQRSYHPLDLFYTLVWKLVGKILKPRKPKGKKI